MNIVGRLYNTAFFKTDEEKKKEEKIKLKQAEDKILKNKMYRGKVGHIHQGLNSFGVWGTLDNGKAKFKTTKFEIHDDKLLIERNRTIINIIDIKEIFQEKPKEAIIILNNGDGIPIQALGNSIIFKAFINILNRLKEKNKSKAKNNELNENTNKTSENHVDRLIKLGEMYEKGLLTDEEFTSMKQKLIEENNTKSKPPKNNVKSSKDSCGNCGSKISPNDAFCSECGTKIN